MLDSIHKTELETKLIGLCERSLGPHGLRPVDVDLRVASRSLVRIFIERTVGEPAGRGTTPSIEDCASASRLIGSALDTENLVPGFYDLEVSSPGLDRRLRLRTDFEPHVGTDVRLKLTEAVPGLGANVTGKLAAVDSDGIVVSAMKKEWPIPLGKIKQANLVWQFNK